VTEVSRTQTAESSSSCSSSSETQGLLVGTMRYFRASDIFGAKVYFLRLNFRAKKCRSPENITSSRLVAPGSPRMAVPQLVSSLFPSACQFRRFVIGRQVTVHKSSSTVIGQLLPVNGECRPFIVRDGEER